MKKNLTELGFILDRSGSMGGLEQDTTDGLENASKRFGYEKIRRMIEREKEQYGWEFLFLGANMTPCRRLPASASRPTGLCGLRMTHRAWRSTTTLLARQSPGCGKHPAARPSAQSGKNKSKLISRSGIIGKGGNSHVRSNLG